MPSFRKIIKAEEMVLGRGIATKSADFPGQRREVAQSSPPGPAAASSQAVEENIIEEIKNAAYQEGYQAGSADAARSAAPHIERVISLLREMGSLKNTIIKEAEGEILKLALAIARVIIRQEIRLHRDYIQPLLQETIRGLANKEKLKIRLNPDDLRYLSEVRSDFLMAIDGIRNLELLEDHSIGSGGALIETGSGEVDARIDRQLLELEKEIFGAYNS